MYMPNDAFIPFVLDEMRLTPEKTGTINLRGRSMRPFLEDGRDKALLLLPHEPAKVGDAVLAELSPGHYVLHRIISIKGEDVTLLGDGNLNPEYCHTGDIRAIAAGFLRKGRKKADLTTGRKWRCYSWIWMRLRPIRRWLLFIMRPHIPQSLTKHIKQ